MGRFSWAQKFRDFLTCCVLLTLLAACGGRVSTDPALITASGLYTLSSSGLQREYYVRLPANYTPDEAPRPLLIALHGAGDSYEGWLAGGFQGEGLLQASASDAIMIIPNARLNVQDRRVWDPGTETDYIFFLDLLAELDRRISYDRRRIFVTGHSAGALMAQELGCRHGDIVRAIAPSAGSITSSTAPRCTGSVAVLQMQSRFDAVVPVAVVIDTRDLWVSYNGFMPEQAEPDDTDECSIYTAEANAYPVMWCLHDTVAHDGHGWWNKADAVIWNFFAGLPVAEPTTSAPPGGGNKKVTDLMPMTLTLTVEFPETMPKVLRAGLFLYPAGSQSPVSGAPLQILNASVDLGAPVAGTRQNYRVPVKLPPAAKLPQSYTLLLAVYVQGGSIPIPTPGVDLSVVYELNIDDATTPVVIPEVLVLKPV